MLFAFTIIWLLLGFSVGFIAGIFAVCKLESDAVKKGYIKIGGTFYQLTEIEFTTDRKE